jgi:hypothetical protein
MHPTGQGQHAGNVAGDVSHVELRIERPAVALEREAFRLGFSGAGCDLGRTRIGVDAAIAQEPAKAGRDTERLDRPQEWMITGSLRPAWRSRIAISRLWVSHWTVPSAAIHSEQPGPQAPAAPRAT